MVSLTIELEFEACLLVGANDGKRSVVVARPVKANAILPPSVQALPNSILRLDSDTSGSPSPLRLTVEAPYGSGRRRGQDLI
jgi:hypothetical protein